MFATNPSESSRAMGLGEGAELLVPQESASDVGEVEVPRSQRGVLRHVAGFAAMLVGLSIAAVCFLPFSGINVGSMLTPGHGVPRTVSRGQFLAKPSNAIGMSTDYEVDDIICDKYPYFKLLEVRSSNLGGQGPDTNAPEGIVYEVQNADTEELMELHLNAKSDYHPEISNYNGCAGLARLTGRQCADHFGAFNLKAGTDTDFSLTFYDGVTKAPKTVNHAAITWFDIDENEAHTNTETVSMSGFADFKLQDPTNVSTSSDGVMTRWSSTSYGDGKNNPVGAAGLTVQQKQLSVTVYYDKVNAMEFNIAAGPGGKDENGVDIDPMPRFFTFILMPSIPCARTLLPALPWKRPEVAIEATGEFYKWKKNIGDPVKPGDVLALKREDGGIKEILAPSAGFLAARQPFKMGDIMEERMEKQPIAVLSTETVGALTGSQALLPALPVRDGQVGTLGNGIFLSWTKEVGDSVKEGDTIGFKNVTENGPTVPILAPYSGKLTDRQPFKRGDVMEDRMEDQPIAVITTVGSLPLGKGDEAALLPKGGLVFVQYKKLVGDEVQEGDVIAVLRDVDGSLVEVKSPKSGFVKSEQLLVEGAPVDASVTDGRIAVIQAEKRLVPLGRSRPVECIESELRGVTFQKFLVKKGDPVDEGTAIASVVMPDGSEELLVSPSAGVVQALQSLVVGDKLEKAFMDGDSCLATILPDAGSDYEADAPAGGGEEVPSTSTSVSAVPGDALVQWHKIEGDPVKEGDVIATMQREGGSVEIKAPRDGVVAFRAPVDDGAPITAEISSPLAIISGGPGSDGGDEQVQGAAGEDGDIFVTWVEQVDDFVNQGDVVCVVRRDGQSTPVRAGTTGKVVFEQGLKPGDRIDGDHVDPLFLIKQVIPPFEETGASTQPGDELVKWEKKLGDDVKRGDTVAVVKQDGETVNILAPQDGTISFEQDVLPGDGIPEEKSSPLFLVKSPTPLPDKIHGVSTVPDEDKLVSWAKETGQPVTEGETVATVLRDGELVNLLAPANGTVNFEQDVKPGDVITKPKNSPLFTVESHDPIGSTSVGQHVESTDILVLWNHTKGDAVKAGDVIAVVTRNGKQVPVTAWRDGWVSYNAPVKAGEEITEANSKPLFSIDDGPYKPLPSGTGQSTEHGDKLVRWHKDLGDPVREGDLVATIDRRGIEVPVYAPRTGKVTFEQPLQAGDPINDENSNPLFIVTSPKPVLPDGVAVNARPGDKFIEWKKKVPEDVGKGEVVAVVERDGERVGLVAPLGGHVAFEQDWKPGQTIDSNTDSPAFLVDPRGYGAGGDGTPVMAPEPSKLGFSWVRFKSWAVAPGDHVKPGDAVAVVELVPPGAARRLSSAEGGSDRRLTIASLLPKEVQVLSPVAGCVGDLMNLHGGDKLEDNYASNVMAKIGGCPLHWSLWLLLLIFVTSCCLCCCVFILLKKREEESYDAMKPVGGDVSVVGALPTPVFDAPQREPEPVSFDFEDQEGRIHSFHFTHRPLGIVYEKGTTPVQVQRCKFNSYARWMGVREGWTIRKIIRTDVSRKSVEEIENLTYDYLRDKPIWPLRLDFKAPLAKGAKIPKDGDTYNKRAVSFMVTTQPIGLEFSHKIPIIVSKIFPSTYASDHGITKDWKLVGIGYNNNREEPLLDLEIDPDDLDYKDVMKNFRDGVSLLDLREDNHAILTNRQVQKWEENLGEETSHHNTGHGHDNGVGRSATNRSRSKAGEQRRTSR